MIDLTAELGTSVRALLVEDEALVATKYLGGEMVASCCGNFHYAFRISPLCKLRSLRRLAQWSDYIAARLLSGKRSLRLMFLLPRTSPKSRTVVLL